MGPARELAGALAAQGVIEVRQGGEPVEADARGPIRLALADPPDD